MQERNNFVSFSLYFSDHATVKEHTGVPESVLRSSGSRTNRP
ncbi:hypothetical protein SRB521_01523 [Intestinimonas butyriciproducens]|nr:hypothetical protein SRB521_01523 [Intestinimonas butyriciproducens]